MDYNVKKTKDFLDKENDQNYLIKGMMSMY